MKRVLILLTVFALALLFVACGNSGGGGGSGTASADTSSAPEPLATFVVEAGGSSFGSITGNPATGTAAIWKSAGISAGPVRLYAHSLYKINFTGDVSGLPGTVPVTVKWSKAAASKFYWGTASTNSGTQAFKVPKSGGSIGQSGTVVDTGSGWRPHVEWPVATGVNSTVGTVRFSAPGVQTLTLTIRNTN